MGYAFVTMSNKDEVEKCFRELNGTMYQGRKINLGSDSSQTKLAIESQSKTGEAVDRLLYIGDYVLFISNMTVNVTHSDLKELFSQHGDVSDVSIMRKKDGSSRGSCLITMTSEAERDKCVEIFHNYELKGSKWNVTVKLEANKNMFDDSVKNDVRARDAVNNVYNASGTSSSASVRDNSKTFSEALKLNTVNANGDNANGNSKKKNKNKDNNNNANTNNNTNTNANAIHSDDSEIGLLDDSTMQRVTSQPDWKPNKSLSKQDHTLVIGNLPPDCDGKQLVDVFRPYGLVVYIHIVNHNTQCYSYLTMANQAEADFCKEQLNNRDFCGKKLTIGKGLESLTTQIQYENSLLFRFSYPPNGKEILDCDIKHMYNGLYSNKGNKNPVEEVSVSRLFNDQVSEYCGVYCVYIWCMVYCVYVLYSLVHIVYSIYNTFFLNPLPN